MKGDYGVREIGMEDGVREIGMEDGVREIGVEDTATATVIQLLQRL